MPVKKKAAQATLPAVPARKTPVKKAAAAKTPAKSAAKKAPRRTLAAGDLPPASSLPPAVLPPPAGKKPRAARQMGDDTPGTALARAVAQAADMKKAENIIILDVRGISMVTDFLVIASGTSMPHIRAIRNEIAERIREDRDEKAHSSQGMAESHWMLLDYGDVVAHVFLTDMRENYALEDLWGDAPRLDWTPL